MSDLADIPTDELRAELERRKWEPAIQIAKNIAIGYGLTLRDLREFRQTRVACEARDLAAYTIASELGLSHPEIGKVLNRTDSAVCYSILRYKRRMESLTPQQR